MGISQGFHRKSTTSEPPNPKRNSTGHVVAEFIHQRPAAQAVAKKVGYQFPNTPEGRFLRGIFLQTVTDLFLWAHRRSAVLHLQDWMFEAEICGIDSDWIRYQFRQAKVNIEDPEP